MKRRLILSDDACYHVISRITERRFYLGAYEKEMFRDMLVRAAGFSGVKVLTYCVLDNHFHILVRVPARQPVSDRELLRRIKCLYRGDALDFALAEFEWCLEAGREHLLAALRERYCLRMYDLSQFVKTLKQRFSIWFNRNHDRRGTLWEGDRFKSVLLEGGRADVGGGCRALLIMSAYIDLNAVRAGLVDDPKDYRWCGYAEALSGREDVCGDLEYVVLGGHGQMEKGCVPWEKLLAEYRELLYWAGDGDKGFNRDQLKAVLDRGGALSKAELLRCRIRYFSAGAVIGGRGFVDDIMDAGMDYFGMNRKSGAKRMRLGVCGDMYTARNLQSDIISLS